MTDAESYTEYGVFVHHGSSEMPFRTFKKAETVGIWRKTPAGEVAEISSIRTRPVTVTRGEWTVMGS